MAINNFFFDPKYQDFIPVTPDVDLNFVKDLTDTYKLNADKADLEKQGMLDFLQNLNLHQTFNEDITEYISNINNQINSIDQKYQGKLLDRNYQNEIRSLTRGISADPGLRYMIKTTEQLNKYETGRQTATDYLPFNDPDQSEYEKVLNRAKGDKPLFTYKGLFKDAKPETDLANVAAAVNIDENTELEFQKDAYGNNNGNVILVDKKTRRPQKIVETMNTYMETYRNTQGGTQLQREAAHTGTTYEELYLKKVNGIGKVLAVEKVKKTLAADNAVQFDIQRDKIAQDLFISLETLKQREKENYDRYIVALTQLAYENKFKTMDLQRLYDQLNLQAEQIDFQTFSKLMEAMGNTYDSTGTRSGGGGGGGTSSVGPNGAPYAPTNPYSVPLRLTGNTVAYTTPLNADKASYEVIKKNHATLLSENSRIASFGFRNVRPADGNNISIDALVDAYANGASEQLKNEAGKTKVMWTNPDGNVEEIPLSVAVSFDASLYKYYQNAIKSKQYDDMLYDIEKISAERFISKMGGIDSESVRGYIADGIIIPVPPGNGKPGHVKFDYGKAYENYDKEFEKLYDPNKTLGVRAKRNNIPNDRGVSVRVPIHALEKIIANGKPEPVMNIEGADFPILTTDNHVITPEIAALFLNDHKNSIGESIADPLVRSIIDARTQAHAEVTGLKGVAGKGLLFNPNGNDAAASIDKTFMSTVNTNLPAKSLYSLDGYKLTNVGGEMYMTGPTGQRKGEPIGYIEPMAITVSPYGEIVVQYNAYDKAPTNSDTNPARRIGTVFSIEEGQNMESVYFTPVLTATYGHNVGTFAGARMSENIAWVANKFPSFRTSNEPQKAETIHPGITVTKDLSNKYTVFNSNTGSIRTGIETDMDLAIVLSLIDYDEQNVRNLKDKVKMPTTSKYGPKDVPLNVDEVVRTANQIGREATGVLQNDRYQAPSLEDAQLQIKGIRIRTSVPQSGTNPQQVGPPVGSTIDNVSKDVVQNIVANKETLFKDLIRVESAGDYTAVNTTPDPITGAVTNAVGKYQFVPSQTYDIVKQAAKNLGISDNFQIWDPVAKTLGKDFEAFKNNPALQSVSMDILLSRNINAYNALEQVYKDGLENMFPNEGLQKWLEIAHLEGVQGAKEFLDYSISGGDLTPRIDRVYSYLQKINLSGAKPSTTPTSSVVDEQLKNLPAGTEIKLSDGSVYKKENPAGRADTNIRNIAKDYLSRLLDKGLSKDIIRELGGEYHSQRDQLIRDLLDGAVEAGENIASILDMPEESITEFISHAGTVLLESTKDDSEVVTGTAQEAEQPRTAKPDVSWYTPKYRYINEDVNPTEFKVDIYDGTLDPNDLSEWSIFMIIESLGLDSYTVRGYELDDAIAEELVTAVTRAAAPDKSFELLRSPDLTYVQFVNRGYQDALRDLYRAINEYGKISKHPEAKKRAKSASAKLSNYLYRINPNITDYINGINKQ